MHKKKGGKMDISLFIVTLILLFFGLIMIALTGAVISKTRFGEEYHLFRRHFLFGVIPGLLIMFFCNQCALSILEEKCFIFVRFSSRVIDDCFNTPALGN